MIYLLFLVILGIPVMTMEYAMGRATRKQMAYHGVLCHRGQLCPADALFHRLLVDPSLLLPHGDRDFLVSNLVLPLIIAFIVCYGIISYF